jgi:hypothetical protein
MSTSTPTGRLRYRLGREGLILQVEIKHEWTPPGYPNRPWKTELRWQDATVERMQELYAQEKGSQLQVRGGASLGLG